MKALIKNGHIIQVSEQEFEVHPDYQWVDCPDDCGTSWAYVDGIFSPPEPEQPLVDPQLEMNKKLNAMWHFCDTGDRSAIEAVKKEI